MKILVIDQCSKAKKTPDVAGESESQQELPDMDGTRTYKARILYEGRQQNFVSEATDILRENGDEVDRFFISAGYGLVEETEELPQYNQTFTGLSGAEIQKRSSELGIQEDILETLEKQYDLIFFVLGSNYYSSLDMERVLEKIPEETIVVTFNGTEKADEEQNHISIPARTEEAKEQGTIVVALKGKYLRNFAEHRKSGADIEDPNDVFEYCTTQPVTQSDFEEY